MIGGLVFLRMYRRLCANGSSAPAGLAALGASGYFLDEVKQLVNRGNDLAVLLHDYCAAACHHVGVLLHFVSSSTEFAAPRSFVLRASLSDEPILAHMM